jgi:hypothetical protein
MLTFTRPFALLLCGALLFGGGLLAAQEACPAPEDLAALTDACADSPLDSACSADGASTPLDDLTTSDQPQVIRLSGSGDGAIALTLVGARVSAYELGEVSGVGQIEIGNSAGYNVNLRGGPGSDFDVVGIFRFDARLMTDGQSTDGAWLRVLLDDGSTAWVSKGLVSHNPALAELPVVDQGSSGAVGHVLTLEPAETNCVDGAAGAFLQADGEATQRLTLNDLPLAVTDGTLFVSFSDAGLVIHALAGSSSVGVGQNQQTLDAGDVVAWADEPTVPDLLPPFPALDVIEALAIEPDVCLIEPLGDSLDALAEPEAEAEVAGSLSGGVSYAAQAQSATNDAQWFQLADGYGSGWVSGEQVRALGPCADLPDRAAFEQAISSAVIGAGLSPDQIMYSYLNARLVADAGQMQALSCASWDAQALLQAQSFRAMRAELLNVACYTVSQSGATAVVQCDGVIQTEYNGELRQWELGAYAMSQEGGAWRVCGETR